MWQGTSSKQRLARTCFLCHGNTEAWRRGAPHPDAPRMRCMEQIWSRWQPGAEQLWLSHDTNKQPEGESYKQGKAVRVCDHLHSKTRGNFLLHSSSVGLWFLSKQIQQFSPPPTLITASTHYPALDPESSALQSWAHSQWAVMTYDCPHFTDDKTKAERTRRLRAEGVPVHGLPGPWQGGQSGTQNQDHLCQSPRVHQDYPRVLLWALMELGNPEARTSRTSPLLRHTYSFPTESNLFYVK